RRVLATPQGLTVTLGIRAAADENLPALTEELQKKIKEYLEGVTGIAVAEVRVKVEDIIIDQVPLKVK
ncbi:MAG TPA: Asp23/Gls24 family envelope stress response protein, partial [Firmicutes bacterium]|nr:Asp23/Gls24 family envelope stress response protein [Bacillota bacterium]